MKINRFQICLILLAGCTVGPKYQPPENHVSDEWQQQDETIAHSEPVIAWWTLFNDAKLNQYIEMAARSNKDLARAEAAICEARALRDVSASKLFPQVSADLSALRTYFSKNGPINSIISQKDQMINPITGAPYNFHLPRVESFYTPIFDATWEIDLFGKTRRAIEAAGANIESAIEQRNGVLIAILSEVARNYMELRGFQKNASLTEENIRLLEQQAQIIRDQQRVGIANELDLQNIEAILANTQSNLPEIVASIYRSIYTLSFLTGNEPEALIDDLLQPEPLPQPPDIVAVGLRSDLLRRRPDVRQAERELAAKTADTGVAVASFYPSFSLIGLAGLQSTQIKNLFQAASTIWTYGENLDIPIFEGGKLVGNLHAAEATQKMAFEQYQQTVLAALQNTESALVAYAEDVKTTHLQQESVERYQKIVDLSTCRFDAGLIGLIKMIDAKLSLIAATQTLLNHETTTLVDLVALYKALGGGWQPEPETIKK